MPRIAFTVLSSMLLLVRGFSQNVVSSGSIRGEVVTQVPNGPRSTYPHVHIVIRGPVNKETESDEQGAFAVEDLPQGVYDIQASAPGLSAAATTDVRAGTASIVPVELSIAGVTSQVTVTASEPAPIEEAAQKSTIGEGTIETAPNSTERIESLLPLVPGVIRGPDGRINMKGTQSTQAGWLVNSANVTDPATGGEALNLAIDVVSSVEVIANPYDPEYGRFTGAISNVGTRAGNFDKTRLSVQNIVPRLRDRDGDVVGIEAFTPRVTVTGPLVKDKIAFTQSFEYRFVRTPVQSLPAMKRDSKLESFDSFSQWDWKINDKQTATASVAVFPEKLDYLGLNTFTPLHA